MHERTTRGSEERRKRSELVGIKRFFLSFFFFYVLAKDNTETAFSCVAYPETSGGLPPSIYIGRGDYSYHPLAFNASCAGASSLFLSALDLTGDKM